MGRYLPLLLVLFLFASCTDSDFLKIRTVTATVTFKERTENPAHYWVTVSSSGFIGISFDDVELFARVEVGQKITIRFQHDPLGRVVWRVLEFQ